MTTVDGILAQARTLLSSSTPLEVAESLHQLVRSAALQHPEWSADVLIPLVARHLCEDWYPAYPVSYEPDTVNFKDPLSPPWFEYEEDEDGWFGEFKPMMQLVRTLNFSDFYTSDSPHILGNSSYLGSVECLDVYTCNFCSDGPEALEAFLAADWISQLRILRMGTYNYVKDEHVVRMAETPGLSNLEALSLQHNEGLGPDSIRAIAESPYFTKLEHLDLKGCFLKEGSGVALLETGLVSRLKTLTLGSSLPWEEVEDFWNSPLLSSLEYLSLSEQSVEELREETGVERPPYLQGTLAFVDY